MIPPDMIPNEEEMKSITTKREEWGKEALLKEKVLTAPTGG